MGIVYLWRSLIFAIVTLYLIRQTNSQHIDRQQQSCSAAHDHCNPLITVTSALSLQAAIPASELQPDLDQIHSDAVKVLYDLRLYHEPTFATQIMFVPPNALPEGVQGGAGADGIVRITRPDFPFPWHFLKIVANEIYHTVVRHHNDVSGKITSDQNPLLHIHPCIQNTATATFNKTCVKAAKKAVSRYSRRILGLLHISRIKVPINANLALTNKNRKKLGQMKRKLQRLLVSYQQTPANPRRLSEDHWAVIRDKFNLHHHLPAQGIQVYQHEHSPENSATAYIETVYEVRRARGLPPLLFLRRTYRDPVIEFLTQRYLEINDMQSNRGVYQSAAHATQEIPELLSSIYGMGAPREMLDLLAPESVRLHQELGITP